MDVTQIDAGDLNVGYVDAGPEDGPAVLLLHGWPYDIQAYDEVTPILVAQGCRVIVPYLRGYGHPGLHVADGSAITANLGVNPSLSITAQAERAMAFWPNRGDVDPRPPLGSAYERVGPVAPTSPAVPPTAPAALRLPLVDIT